MGCKQENREEHEDFPKKISTFSTKSSTMWKSHGAVVETARSLRLTKKAEHPKLDTLLKHGAGNEARTRFPASHESPRRFAGTLPHLGLKLVEAASSLCLTKKGRASKAGYSAKHGAGNEARTRYLHLGKVALYQMSYARVLGRKTAFCRSFRRGNI